MMFNWGPPGIRVILWLSYPPVRYLDTIGCLRATSVKWIWISLHVFVFHHILLLDYKTLSQRLARQKQGASMDVSMVSMVWVWCEYGWLPFFPVCRAATVTSTSFLSVLHFLFAIQRCSSLSKYYVSNLSVRLFIHENIAKMTNAVQVTLWLSITNPHVKIQVSQFVRNSQLCH